MTIGEINQQMNWCLREAEWVKRIHKKMTNIVLAALQSGNIDRILEAAKMEIVWTTILSKKISRIEEIRKRLDLEIEAIRKRQQKTPDLETVYYAFKTKKVMS